MLKQNSASYIYHVVRSQLEKMKELEDIGGDMLWFQIVKKTYAAMLMLPKFCKDKVKMTFHKSVIMSPKSMRP